jgi:hypothetical protein
MIRKIYVFTTQTDRQRGRYKFGQTINDSNSRVKQQQTGNSEKLEIICTVESELTDHYIHDKLENEGYSKVGLGGDEWFETFQTDDEAISVFLKILNYSKSIVKVKYSPRFYQSHVKSLFLDKLSKETNQKKEFALELAPRFGKTPWSLDLMLDLKKMGYKTCLLPAYVLTAISSFEKEFYTFEGFSDEMVFVHKGQDYQKIYKDNYGKKLIVLPVSLHEPEYESTYDYVKNLPSQDKVAIIDEADFGCHRHNSQSFINFLNSGLNIYMTGTAIERVVNPLQYVGDNIIRWSYSDMLMVKKGEHPIQTGLQSLENSKSSVKDIVVPQFMRLSLGGVVDNFYSVEPEYRTDWNKLFSDVYKAKPVLSNLIKSLFGEYNGKSTYLVDLNTSEICPKDVTMIFAGTPDKKQQNKFHKLVQDSLGPQYIVELINGDETSNREVERMAQVVVARAQRERKKVVFISKDMGSRSFSVSEIDTVMLMFDRGSYATISQKVSRVLTPGKTYDGDKKVYGNVISLSLDPNREQVNPIDEYLVYEGEKVQVNELSDGIHRVLRSVNIFVNDEGMMEPIISDEYATKLISSSALIRVGMETVKVDSIINDVELVKLLTGVEVNNQTEDEKIEGVDSSKIIRNDEDKIKEEKKIKKVIEDVYQKLKEVLSNIVENIVEISEINNCESDNIITTLDMIYEKGYCDEVVFEVGLDCQTVKKIILTGALSEKLLNTIITSYNKSENSISL